MVTNYPQQLTATAGVSTGERDKGTEVRTGDGAIARAIGRLGQLLCGLGGHDAVLHVEGKRVMMRCSSCGHDTPGWEISGRGPRRRYEGDARRHLITTRQLVLRKSA
jgi:hypothetical protein